MRAVHLSVNLYRIFSIHRSMDVSNEEDARHGTREVANFVSLNTKYLRYKGHS